MLGDVLRGGQCVETDVYVHILGGVQGHFQYLLSINASTVNVINKYITSPSPHVQLFPELYIKFFTHFSTKSKCNAVLKIFNTC
jgi:hypothetical protein